MKYLITILLLGFFVSSEAQNVNQSQIRQFNSVPAYRVFGRGSGVGSPSFIQLDSNHIPLLHSQGYYDGRFQPLGSYLSNITGLISAGTNVSVTGSGTSASPYVINSTASGGGVSGLTNKAFLFGQSDGTIGQDTTISYESASKTLRGGTIVSEDFTGKSIVFVGNSITFGTGATSNYFRYSTLATRLLSGYGLSEDNRGVSGALVSAAGFSSIPNKTSTMKFLVIQYGINEVIDSANWSHATFVSSYKAFLDNAISKGWVGSDMIIVNIGGYNYGLNGTTSNSRQKEFNAVIDSFHTVYGTAFAEIYDQILTPEYNYVTKATLHPDNGGHEIMAYIVAGAIKGNFNLTNQKLAVNGTTQLSSLVYKNQLFLRKGLPLGIDSAGNVGVLRALPPYMATQGKLYTNGAIIQRGAIVPTTTDSVYDYLLNTSSTIQQAATTTAKGTLVLMGASGQTTLGNTFNNGNITFNVSGGTTGGVVTGLQVLKDGTISTPVGISIGAGKTITTTGTTSGGTLNLLSTANSTDLSNGSAVGAHRIFESNGVAAGSVQMFNMNAYGRTILQNGGAITDVLLSRFTVNSTTEGSLPFPRMTNTQRDALSGILVPSITTAGSGQTNGTYAITISGTGTGATASVLVVGGAAISVTILTAGVGYTGTATGTISAGGTSATFSFTTGTTEGIHIYSLTDHADEYYNGTVWKTITTN